MPCSSEVIHLCLVFGVMVQMRDCSAVLHSRSREKSCMSPCDSPVWFVSFPYGLKKAFKNFQTGGRGKKTNTKTNQNTLKTGEGSKRKRKNNSNCK